MAGNGKSALRIVTLVAAMLAALTAEPARSTSVTVTVVDDRGRPIDGVAVYAEPRDPPAATDRTVTPVAVMDQADNAFVPHMLVVEAGTNVLFPNNDTVSHHVYSFSEAKRFELGLYNGTAHPPLAFDTPGIVVLGCNIHDGMLGYIVVVDTPHFGLTDHRGRAALDALPSGEYTLRVWTPRLRDEDLPAPRNLAIAGDDPAAITFELASKLLPDHDHGGAGLSWQRY
jgi:plastocyanin